MIMFKTLAVLPACSLTPLASYITTILKMSEIAKPGLLVPSMTPSAVVSPRTWMGTIHRARYHWRPCQVRFTIFFLMQCVSLVVSIWLREGGRVGGEGNTIAVCEEGMPPEPTMRVGSHRFSVYQNVKSFVI